MSAHLFPLIANYHLVSLCVGLELRKKKNEKVKTIVWRETASESCEQELVSWTVVPHSIHCEFPYLLPVDSSLFTRQPISKPVFTGPSPLAKLLAEQEKKVSNPFFQYSKFNGEVSLRWLSRSIGSGDIALCDIAESRSLFGKQVRHILGHGKG